MTADNRISVDPAAIADAATNAILADLAGTDHKAVVVDSPPGAGKSTLVVRAAVDLIDGGERPIIVAQTNNQVDDLILRLAKAHPGVSIGRLSGAAYTAPPAVDDLTNATVASSVADLAECQIIVGTSASGRRSATSPSGGRSWTSPTRCARTCCCTSSNASTAACSSEILVSSTRSPSSEPNAGSDCPMIRRRAASP